MHLVAKRKRETTCGCLHRITETGPIDILFTSTSDASMRLDDEFAIVVVEKEQPTNGNSESEKQEENVDTNINDDNVSGSPNVTNSLDAHLQSPSVHEHLFFTLIFMLQEIGAILTLK